MVEQAGETSTSQVEPLASYLPRFLLERLRENPEGPEQASVEKLEAAVMLVDLTDFTSYAESFEVQGSAGADALSQFLDAHFSQLSEEIFAHGGDVLLFAGDSVLSFWPARGNLEVAVSMAVQCSVAIRNANRSESDSPAKRAGLTSRVAIGAGELQIHEIGGVEDRWTTLVVGAAIRQLAAADNEARVGGIALSHQAWSLVADRCKGEVGRSGAVRLDAVVDPVVLPKASVLPDSGRLSEAARRRLPQCTADLAARRLADQVPEFRSISIAFINFPTLRFDDESDADLLQAAAETIQGALARFEGSLYQFLMDEKGVSTLAAFGLPPRAHENDPERALRACLEIREGLAQAGIESAIGVASGAVFCGPCGGESRRQYSIIGSTINRAARLMGVASDEVLCDPATAHAARRRIELEKLPDIHLRGHDQPVALHRLKRVRPEATKVFDRALLGRDGERALLAERLRDLIGGHGGVVLIEGEPGVGKSHLLADFVRRARELAVQVAIGEGDAIEISTPYYAWRRALAGVLMPRADEPSERIDILRARLVDSPSLIEWLPVLNDVMHTGFEETELTLQMSSTARSERARALVVELLRQETVRGPTVLMLDDAHWLDAGSLDLAMVVAKSIPELLIVVAARPADGEFEPLAELSSLRGAARLNLDALPAHQIDLLVSQRLGVESLPEEVSALIRDRAEGNPFYSEELAFALRGMGALVVENGRCYMDVDEEEAAALSLPASLQGAITSRIDLLKPSEQIVLKAASVIGTVVRSRMLCDIADPTLSVNEIEEALDSLVKHDVLQLELEADESTFRFKHVLTREVAYLLMLGAQRAGMHRRAGEWLEKEHPSDRAPVFALLAHHWELAQEPESALGYLEQAGAQAVRTYSNRAACDFLNRATSLAAEHEIEVDAERRSHWAGDLAEAKTKLGEYDDALESLREALVLRKQPPPRSQLALIGGLLTQIMRQIWHRAVGVSALPSSGARRDQLAFGSHLNLRWAETAFVQGDVIRAVYVSLRSLNAAETLRSAGETSNCLASIGLILSLFGMRRAAENYTNRSLQLARDEGSMTDLAWAQLIVSIQRVSVGDWEFVDDACTASRDAYDRLGDSERSGNANSIRAFMLLARGRFEEAYAAFIVTFDSSSSNSAVANRIWGLAGQIASLLPTDVRHVSFIDELAALAEQAQSPADVIFARSQLALARLRRGEADLALEQANEVLEIATKVQPAVYYGVWSLAGAAEVFEVLLEGERDTRSSRARALRKSARRTSRILTRFSFMNPLARPRAQFHAGKLAWSNGRERRAKRLLRRSLVSAESMRMPYEQGLALFELGRHEKLGSVERQKILESAASIFEELGAKRDYDRTRRELEA